MLKDNRRRQRRLAPHELAGIGSNGRGKTRRRRRRLATRELAAFDSKERSDGRRLKPLRKK